MVCKLVPNEPDSSRFYVYNGPMRILTIHAEWAWAIMAGHKRVENRKWTTQYRGSLVIHAGLSTASTGTAISLFQRLGIAMPSHPNRGCALGVVDLVDVVPVHAVSSDPFAVGPWCFMLRNPQRFRHPIPLRGSLGLGHVSPELERDCHAALAPDKLPGFSPERAGMSDIDPLGNIRRSPTRTLFQ